MEIRFPLFVRAKDSGEIYKFGSIYELQHEVEEIDIENKEYEAWDSAGIPVEMKAQKPIWLKLSAMVQGKGSNELLSAVEQFGQSVGLKFSEPLTISSIEHAVDEARAELERQLQAKRPLRRLIAGL